MTVAMNVLREKENLKNASRNLQLGDEMRYEIEQKDSSHLECLELYKGEL